MPKSAYIHSTRRWIRLLGWLDRYRLLQAQYDALEAVVVAQAEAAAGPIDPETATVQEQADWQRRVEQFLCRQELWCEAKEAVDAAELAVLLELADMIRCQDPEWKAILADSFVARFDPALVGAEDPYSAMQHTGLLVPVRNWLVGLELDTLQEVAT